MAVDKKAHIMDHAIALFADRGVEGTSIRELATNANVNVAMINYYFGSKEKLVEAIIEDKVTYMKDKIEEMQNNEALTEIEKIDTVIKDYVTRKLEGATFNKFLYKELMDTKREDILIKAFSSNAKNVAAIIEKGIQKKVFKKVDPMLTVASMVGTISYVMMSKIFCNKLLQKPETNEPYMDEEFKRRLIEHITKMMHAHLLIDNS
jgi:AcrR family transcriptional regulator